MIILMISNTISYHSIPWGSICSRSAGALAPSSGLSATLPRLCRPDPALARTLSPDPLRLSNNTIRAWPLPLRHIQMFTRLVEPATVASVALGVCRGKMPIVPEAVWNRGVTVATHWQRRAWGVCPAPAQSFRRSTRPVLNFEGSKWRIGRFSSESHMIYYLISYMISIYYYQICCIVIS